LALGGIGISPEEFKEGGVARKDQVSLGKKRLRGLGKKEESIATKPPLGPLGSLNGGGGIRPNSFEG